MEQKGSKKTIKDLGEFGLIKYLTEDVIIRHAGTRKGIGDDAAVIDHGNNETVVTTDLLLEGIHFDLTYVPLKHLGYKAAIANFSDVYAMNAMPTQITVSIGISSKMQLAAVKELYDGIKLACNLYDVDLVGGDTTASLTGLLISITALGIAAPGSVVYRSGAKQNDLICVSGDLGAAYMGLLLLQREKKLFEDESSAQPQLSDFHHIIERQLKPEARKDIINHLRNIDLKPSSMIDISDGLSSELLHLCDSSKLGCKIYAEKIPIHEETDRLAVGMGLSPLVAALNGGEDYELLFTIPLEHFDKIQDQTNIHIIGHMCSATEGCNMILQDDTTVPLIAQGWSVENAMS